MSEEFKVSNVFHDRSASLKVLRLDDETNRPIIQRVQFEGKKFRNIVVLNAIFDDFNFDSSDLTEARVCGCAFFGGTAIKTNMNGLVSIDNSFEAVSSIMVDFKFSQFSQTHFKGVNLIGSDFSNAVLEDCNFSSDFTDYKTDLKQANFSNATFDNVVFDGVVYNSTTIFPKNFNPSMHDGLIFEK